jgi:4'-phosphopantetheinyl transferase
MNALDSAMRTADSAGPGSRKVSMGTGTHLWLAFSGSVSQSQFQRYRSVLSLEEQDQAQRFYFEHDRTRYVLAHALARAALAYVSGCSPRELCFGKGPYGRPHAQYPDEAVPLSFNISHTAGLVGVALSTCSPVGLDIEFLQREIAPLEIGRITMTAEELSMLRALGMREMREQFLRLWVLKESYIKARGTGFSTDPTSFSFRFDESSLTFSPPADDARIWSFQLLPIPPSHVLAVCRPAPDQPVHLHDSSDLLSKLE